MRTTIQLDDDVLDRARALSRELDAPFRTIINDALRAGLDSIKTQPPAKPYSMVPHKMSLKPGYNLDNIQELLAQIEGEDHR